ncbi:MerR family transcriptional regulator [Paracoccus sp. (in: a-proteobacteria)]|uniref:MerR family transcriptional regulator n=1 Tax=Paracoccus sp. TaxID=267 RepID=UPI0028A228B3|nr:MerR family transcriptional regulator [Paracoccus sp. (in: a-proteobacteria)]
MTKAPEAFRSIGEVSRLVGVATHVLRYWEGQFTQLSPVKRADGRRYYRPEDIKLVAGLCQVLREDGLSIRGAKRLIAEDRGAGLRQIGAARLGEGMGDGALATTRTAVRLAVPDAPMQHPPPLAASAHDERPQAQPSHAKAIPNDVPSVARHEDPPRETAPLTQTLEPAGDLKAADLHGSDLQTSAAAIEASKPAQPSLTDETAQTSPVSVLPSAPEPARPSAGDAQAPAGEQLEAADTKVEAPATPPPAPHQHPGTPTKPEHASLPQSAQGAPDLHPSYDPARGGPNGAYFVKPRHQVVPIPDQEWLASLSATLTTLLARQEPLPEQARALRHALGDLR